MPLVSSNVDALGALMSPRPKNNRSPRVIPPRSSLTRLFDNVERRATERVGRLVFTAR
jgi:hypothetical protein